MRRHNAGTAARAEEGGLTWASVSPHGRLDGPAFSLLTDGDVDDPGTVAFDQANARGPSVKYWIDDGCHSSEVEKIKPDDVEGYYEEPSAAVAGGARCCSHDGANCTTTVKCKKTTKWTFAQAEQHCANQGKRLCTKEELLSDMCCGTGGNCDSHAVWTSTTKPPPTTRALPAQQSLTIATTAAPASNTTAAASASTSAAPASLTTANVSGPAPAAQATLPSSVNTTAAASPSTSVAPTSLATTSASAPAPAAQATLAPSATPQPTPAQSASTSASATTISAAAPAPATASSVTTPGPASVSTTMAVGAVAPTGSTASASSTSSIASVVSTAATTAVASSTNASAATTAVASTSTSGTSVATPSTPTAAASNATNASAVVSTSLIAPVSAGVTTLQVASQLGFAVGDTVNISGGGNSEIRSIAGLGSIVLDRAVNFSYPVGSSVTKQVNLTNSTADTWKFLEFKQSSNVVFSILIGAGVTVVFLACVFGVLRLGRSGEPGPEAAGAPLRGTGDYRSQRATQSAEGTVAEPGAASPTAEDAGRPSSAPRSGYGARRAQSAPRQQGEASF